MCKPKGKGSSGPLFLCFPRFRDEENLLSLSSPFSSPASHLMIDGWLAYGLWGRAVFFVGGGCRLSSLWVCSHCMMGRLCVIGGQDQMRSRWRSVFVMSFPVFSGGKFSVWFQWRLLIKDKDDDFDSDGETTGSPGGDFLG
ncbi:Uncharacterized protein Rs2_07961 [Raphanus sativus]|nr:Uncharacterized protein Rs2_07961 [Raphanus sativus]